MKNWRAEMQMVLKDFFTVSELAGVLIKPDDLQIEYLAAPHKQPTKLPEGKMAVYAFWWNDEWLKIGKAGPNSNARYTSQHYTGSALSTLAGSLSNDPLMGSVEDFDIKNPKNWIRRSTCRVNILMSSKEPKELLSLLEIFLQARFKPRYEG